MTFGERIADGFEQDRIGLDALSLICMSMLPKPREECVEVDARLTFAQETENRRAGRTS